MVPRINPSPTFTAISRSGESARSWRPTGTVGDSYDNALAENFNGAYKTELIRRCKPFESVQALEQATFQWVSWWNSERLHEHLGYRTPAEVEACYYQTKTTPVTP